MDLKDVKEIKLCPKIKFGPPAPAPFWSDPWIVAGGDVPGSYVVYSARLTDVCRAAKRGNLKKVFYGNAGKFTYYAIMAYCTSYPALCGALDLLSLPTEDES